MWRSLVGTAAVAVSLSQASAADLQRPVLKAPPPSVFSWTGFYIGVHAGWLRSDNNVTDIDGLQDDDGTRFGYSNSAFVGGGHFGYNWQSGMFVFGVEADISGTGAKSSVIQDNTPGSGFDQDGLARTKLSWLASARGRLGMTIAPQWLLYGTGGAAWAHVRNETLDFDTGVLDPSDSSSRSGVRSGWVAGGGVEFALYRDWLLRVEYLHYDLGNSTTITPDGDRFRFSNEIDVVRAGLSRKF
jgi:outer membrane immunogenic protein